MYFRRFYSDPAQTRPRRRACFLLLFASACSRVRVASKMREASADKLRPASLPASRKRRRGKRERERGKREKLIAAPAPASSLAIAGRRGTSVSSSRALVPRAHGASRATPAKGPRRDGVTEDRRTTVRERGCFPGGLDSLSVKQWISQCVLGGRPVRKREGGVTADCSQ